MKTHSILLAALALLSFAPVSKAQDTILKQNKEVILARILEVSPKEVTYKRFDLQDGPLFIVPKTDIIRIKYRNGSTDELSKEQPDKPPVDDLSPRYIILLNDGSQLQVRIVSETGTEVIVVDDNFGQRTISRDKIKNMSLQYGDQVRVFTLRDGTIVTGKIINKTAAVTVVETKELGVLNLPQAKIMSVRELEEATITEKGKIWFKNPNCTRYLFAPSAIPLKKGEGYYQNIYGAGNAVNFGVNSHITIGGGLIGPLGAYINAKVGFKLGENLHIAGGALLGNGFFPVNGNNLGLGLGFGVITIGNYDHNITVGAGYGIINRYGTTEMMDKPMYVANGMARLGKKYALVTENWVVNVQGDPFDRGISAGSHYETFFSYAFRYMGQRSTLDAGFLNTPGLINKGWYIGIPYIGFVIRFGNYRD